jgi:hypothetical protein
VDINSLNLPAEVRKRLIQLAGLRYRNGTLYLVACEQPTVEQNRAFAFKLLRDILHESFLIFPHYVPLSDEQFDPNELVTSTDSKVEEVKKPDFLIVDPNLVPFVEGISEHISAFDLIRYNQPVHPKLRMTMGLHPVSKFNQEYQLNIDEKESRTDKKYYTVFRYHPTA